MKRRSPSRRSRGFTLIEVLLVLVILVVLASLAVPAYGLINKRMQMNAAKAQIGLFEQAIQAYQTMVGDYPKNLDALRHQPPEIPQDKWGGPYLNKDVTQDPWGHPYQYATPGMHNPDGFDVWTVGPDGRELGNWNEVRQ